MLLLVAAISGGTAAGRDQTPAPAASGKAHPEIPDTEAATCLTCHEDIGKGKVVHAPVEGGLCTGCHEFSGTGDDTKISLAGGATSDAVSGLCTTCHDDVANDLKAAVQHAPVQSGECLTCHDPHKSEQAGLLKGAQGELCVTCHDGVADALKKASVHAPAASRCSTCHNPHGSAKAMLLWEAPNALCQACHALPAVVPGMPPPEKVTVGERAVIVKAELPLSKQTNLDSAGRGHPLVNHPTSGPSDPLKKDRPFTCVSCHAPHGSATPKLIAFELKPGEGVCQKCHEM
jgi:predicted CXXCH cytochrome family protein